MNKNISLLRSIVNKNKKQIIEIISIAVFVLIYFFLSALGLGCPFKYVFGVSCPGCGMTRAYIALLSLDIPKAFHYHPLFPLVPLLIYFIYAKKRKLSRPKVKNAALISISILFIVVYLIRLLVLKSDVVTIGYPKILIDIRNGILFLEGKL